MIYKTKPMAHQEAAVEQAVASLPRDKGMALFMDIGTGKTKAAIDIWMNLVHQGIVDNLLVVCPKTLYLGWRKELADHADATALAWGKDFKANDKGMQTIMTLPMGSVVLINVEAFQMDNKYVAATVKKLASGRTLFVLDESARCKNPTAQRSKRVLACAKSMTARVIMTGTEIASGLQDIYSQLEIMMPGFWKAKTGIGNHFLWKHEFCIITKGFGPDGKTFDKLLKPSEMSPRQLEQYNEKLRRVNQIIAPYVFRAKREDCLDLPDKIHETIFIELSEPEKKAYKDMKDLLIHELESGDTVAVDNPITLYMRLRQITGGFLEHVPIVGVPSKLQALLDDIEDHDERAVIVAYFRAEIAVITAALAGYGASVLHGDIKDREEELSLFLSGKHRFLVAQHDMVAEGLNLQENCALMYIYSRSLNANTNAQYEGRIHRIGQKKHPVYRHLIVPNTVDEKVQKVVDAKISIQELFSRMKVSDIEEYL